MHARYAQMKITLINPPFLFPVEHEITLSHCLGLRYISSYLKTNGSHQIVFIDALNQGLSNIKKFANGYIVGLEIEDIVRQIPRDTDLIGISVPFSQLAPIAHDIVDLIKSRFPNKVVVMGGVYPSTQPELALLSKADVIVVGEGETALLQIADGKSPKDIKGVYASGNTREEKFLAADLIEDLDRLPFPDDSLPNMDRYFSISPRNDRTHRTASIITSRGCPFSCEFCSIHPVYGHKWRGRSAENVLSEMEYLIEKHGINGLEIEDDNFTLEKQRTVDILEGIVGLNEKGANLMWRTPNGVRIDTIDADIARLIKRSNCQEIVVALEHGDKEMLRLMNKQLDLDKAYNVIRMLVEQEIPHITIFVIVGYPGESGEHFLNGLDYLKRIKELGGSVSLWVNIAQPYPGTKLLTRCKEEGYLSDNSIDNFLVNRKLMSTEHFVPITTPDFDSQEVLRRKRMMQRIFEDQVRILLCGWYFQGNRGDDLSIEPITKTLSKYGEVKVSTTEIFDRDLIDWCDLLVIGSGSHITPRGISSYRQVKYAKENGKKVIYYSQTIEGGHPLFVEHLARADLITVRDSESKRIVEANGFRAVLSVDPLFRKKRRTIGCSFRRWVNEPPAIEEKLASLLDNLAVDYEVVFLPFTETDTDTESDKTFHERVMQKMKNRAKQASYDHTIENVDLLIGMRLHALICALNMGKQVLAIDYDVKIRRIFSDLGMQDRVVSYDEADKIPLIIREKIFRSDGLALREKVNEALVGRICADIKGDPPVKVSVVMPTYNRAGYLKEAVDSILAQTISDWELILIDDGSTDDTRESVESYKDRRIKYYNFGHNGIAFSRNIGNLLSRGEIIVVADSDDVNLPDRLEVTCQEMEKSNADMIYSSMFHFDNSGKKELVPSHPFSGEKLKDGNFIYHPTVAYRRDVAMKCPYAEDLEMVEDYHMYLQAAEEGYRFHQIEKPLVMHRIHDEQISSARSEEMAEIHRRIVDSAEGKMKEERKGDNPLVSVIVPTYNRPDMLRKALMSVLSQTYQNIEIIVVNDAGMDVQEVVDSLNTAGKIVYIQHEENRGLPAARNTGIKRATGKYIAYLDDDDIYYPNHLEKLVNFLENSDYKVAYADCYHAFQEWITDRYVTVGKKIIYSQDFDRQRLLVSNYIPVLNVVHRRDIVEVAGLFDETLGALEDWDMWIRFSQYSDFHHINVPTAEVSFRADGTTMTSRDRTPFLRALKIIHKRYSHLVADPRIFEEQKKAEENLAKEVEIGRKDFTISIYEYLHRYRFAMEFVRGKKVLDLRCGEGYGSFLLSEAADSVVGLDQDETTIRKGISNYIRENLTFIKGSLTDIPIKEEKIFDVMVCFARVEHIQEHDRLMREVKRLLKPNGIFIFSIPNMYLDSKTDNQGPHSHGGEIYFDKFKELLSDHFKHILLYGQKIYPSSNIFPLHKGAGYSQDFVMEKGDNEFLFVPLEKRLAGHFIAVASDRIIEKDRVLGSSHLLDISETLFHQRDARIGNLEAGIRDRDTHIGNLEAAIRDKDTHIGNLERQREENYRDWRASENNLKAIIEEKQTHIGNLEAGIREKDTHIGNLEAGIREKDTHISTLEAGLRDKDTHIGSREAGISDKDSHIGSLEAVIREKDAHIANIDATLNNIYNSHGWKALLAYYRLRDKIFPFNTKRRVFAIIVFRVLWNPLAIFRGFKKDNIKKFFYYLKNAGPSVLEEKIEKRIFSGKIKIYCDRASIISNTITVTGWAIAEAGIEKVEIFSDGILLGWTSCEHPRHDVHRAFPQIKNSLNSGYFFHATSGKEFPAGSHTLLIRATSIDGEKTEITKKITVVEQTSTPLPIHKSKQCLRPVRRTLPEVALRFQPGEDELKIELNKIKSELAQALPFQEKNQ